MRKLQIGLLLLLLLVCAQQLQAAGFSINAEVDRNQVGFGESLNLVITITQSLNSGVTQRINIPALNNIPGFDIASTRSGQSTSFINGVGQTQSQVVYELVPQQPGKVTIPGFSFKDADGDEHSSKPIEVTVAPQVTEPETPAEEPPPAAENSSTGSMFKGLLLVGLILGCIVALPFVLSAFFNRNIKPSTRWNEASAQGAGVGKNAAAGGLVQNQPRQVVEEAVIITDGARQSVANKQQRIDFASLVARLKRENPDANGAFYKKYFDLFRDAALGECRSLSADMTSDEMFKKVCELATAENITQASRRLSADLEMVMYANRAPARAFSAIDADAMEIINAISE